MSSITRRTQQQIPKHAAMPFVSSNFMDCKVFISYSHSDLPIIKDFVKFFRDVKLDVWFDKEDLRIGEDWKATINKVISNAQFYIVFLSQKNIDRRGFLQYELNSALDVALTIPPNQLYIIPLRLDNCDIPDRLTRFHSVSLIERENFDILVKTLLGETCDILSLKLPLHQNKKR